jgi:hypothetical protein
VADRAPQAAAALRAERPRPDHPRHDLEHGGERRRLRCGIAFGLARRRGNAAGEFIRRRVPPLGRRRALLARHGIGARAA